MAESENNHAESGKAPEKHKGEGHRERLRERFLTSGLDGFLDYEVIELLLTLGTPRRDCKQAAKDALARFGSLQGVLEATSEQLRQVKGIGPKNAFGIKLIQAVSQRFLEKKVVGKDHVSSARELFDYLFYRFRDKKKESFTVVYLNNSNQVLAVETLFDGTVGEAAVYTRELVQAALERGATSLLLAHNHPSGDIQPSRADIAITRKIMLACLAIDIKVHEHIIIGDNQYFSFRENGVLADIEKEYQRTRMV
ncbi:MAG: RadC family protein [Desulfatibacillaceae bacterium]